jgi:hypothetical protein
MIREKGHGESVRRVTDGGLLPLRKKKGLNSRGESR